MARAALNTQMQQFMTESFVKERNHRLSWYLRNKGLSSAPPSNSRQTEVFRKQLESTPKTDFMAKIKDFKETQHHRHKPNYDNLVLEMKLSKEGIDTDMAKPTKSQTAILFDGFSNEGKGRYAYLKKRILTRPEDKFQHPTCSSWEYGWRLGDYIKKEEIKKPVYGRTRIVRDTFYTRNGVPQHPQ